MVSGTLSLPSRGTFHHSLTVLIPLSVIRKYLALPGGPGRFTRNSTSSVLLGHTHTAEASMFRLRDSHPLRSCFPPGSTTPTLVTDRPCWTRPCTPHNTLTAKPARLTLQRFRLIQFRSPLLPESLLFSLPAGTEMFHFPAFPPHALYIQTRVTTLTSGGVSPFGDPRINACLSAPRGLSQISTSFIGS